MKTKVLFLAVSLIFLGSVPTWAQQQVTNPDLVARLEQMVSEGDWQARNLTGGAKQKWLLHQVKIRGLVNRLKAGQSVDPKEIDQILKEHAR